MKPFASGVFATLLIFSAASSANAAGNLVKNGSFEKPAVPDGGGMFFSPGDHFSGWTVVGDSGNVGVDSGDVVFCNHSFPAKKGKQWLDLTGNTDSGSATGVQRTIATIPGSTYLLSFFIGNVVDTGGICGTSSTVNVVIDGVPLASFTSKAGKGSSSQVWKKFSTEFVAENAQTAIAFINGDPAGDFDNGLDGVSVTLVIAP